MAGVPEVLAGNPHPSLRLRPRRRADHLQGVGLHQSRLRLQPPHRQRRDLLRPGDRAELQVRRGGARGAAACRPSPSPSPPPCFPSYPRPIRRLGCARRRRRHRARHAHGDRGPRGRRGARRALRAPAARRACSSPPAPGTTAATAGCWRARSTGSTCRSGSTALPGAGAALREAHGALARAPRACARWRPTARGPASACWSTRCSAPGRGRAPRRRWPRCSSGCSISRCRSSRSTDRPGSISQTGIVHGAPRADAHRSPSAGSAAATCSRGTRWATSSWSTSAIRRPIPRGPSLVTDHACRRVAAPPPEPRPQGRPRAGWSSSAATPA